MSASKLQNFLQHLKLERGYSPATLAAYASDLKQYFKSGQKDLNAYVALLQESGLTLRSIHRKLSALNSYFDFLVCAGAATENPASKIELASYATPPPEAPALSETQTLFEKIPPPTDPDFVPALLLRMLYACGLRVSELTQADVSQLDLEKGLLRVLGKGGKTRVVPIDSLTIALLKKYLRELRPQRAKCDRAKCDRAKRCAQKAKRHAQTSAVFLTPAGRAYTRQAVWKALKRIALKNDVHGDLSPHALRHAYATHCLENGMNLRTLQMLLGHADISTTQIYTSVTNRHLRESLEKFHPRSLSSRSPASNRSNSRRKKDV